MKKSALAAAITAALAATPARSQEFLAGDYWIASQGIGTSSVFAPGVARVDACTGATQLVLPLSSVLHAASTFDPSRNAFLVGAPVPSSPANVEILAVKADGSWASLGVGATGLFSLAATGDGRLYFIRSTTPNRIQYADAANVVHDLLDATGSAPLALPPTFQQRSMHYDAATNALFFGDIDSGTPCAISTGTAWIRKVPLAPGGALAAGPVQSGPVCVLNGDSALRVVNLSEGPGDTVFAVLDDNTNGAVARMITVDKATLAVTPFAMNGPDTGAAATVAGVYNKACGFAVINDGFEPKLRLYGPGMSGNGVTWVTGGVSVHADAHMTRIPESVVQGVLPFGTGTPGCAGAQALWVTTTPKVGASGFRFTCTNAPPSALGLLIVGNAPDFAGSDPFAFGALLHVSLFASTFLEGLDLTSSSFGLGSSPAPIPISPVLAGQTVVAQALWVWSGCATPSPVGISTSTGLGVTFQP